VAWVRSTAVKAVLRIIFGAHGQLAVGVVACVVTLVAWGYGSTLHGEALIRFLFHMSMFFGLLAAYAIVATALGYRATERVEAAVVEKIEKVDEVNVTA
jgi:hypothetical protein